MINGIHGSSAYQAVIEMRTARQNKPAAPEETAAQASSSSSVTLSPQGLALQENGQLMIGRLSLAALSEHRISPDAADPLEQMAYSRDKMRISIQNDPPTWRDTGEPVDIGSWMAAQKEVDARVDGRVAVYEQARSEGLSSEEILARLQEYNASLPANRYEATLTPPPQWDARMLGPKPEREPLSGAALEEQRIAMFNMQFQTR